MPSTGVVPKKLRVPEWFVSSFMMDRALEAVVRQIKGSTAVTTFRISPDTARMEGQSTSIGICRNHSCFVVAGSRSIGFLSYTRRWKTLMDHLGLRYLHAHQIATRAEQAAVRASAISWYAYDRFLRMYVKRIGDARVTKVPRDLDLKP